jgi:hypothetical protein
VKVGELPNWATEVVTLLPACSQFLLSGNVRDLFFFESADDDAASLVRKVQHAPTVLATAFAATQEMPVTIRYDITDGASVVPIGDQAAQERAHSEAARLLGGDPASIAPHNSLMGLSHLIDIVSTAAVPIPLVITSSSRLVRDVDHLSDQEFEFFRTVDRYARSSRPAPDSPRRLYSPVVWILDKAADVPSWFAVGNDFLRSVVLPLPHTGERQEFGNLHIGRLKPADESAQNSAVNTLSQQTAGMTLVAMERTIAIAQDRGLGADRVEDAARSYRVGVTDNPWRADYISKRLRTELLAEPADGDDWEPLRSRVLGQDLAVKKALDILVRSATNLTAAQASASATRPRGVLFFAGPTGVGKTELAKALTKLLFDDERFYIRFDMSEFSAEHAEARLLGAPPGYVGHDAGGELTNAVRRRPFCLLLFDEIEKANPRILDKFLQILEDGRLTDGAGSTVHFGETLIVFTSNLGIHEEVRAPSADGREVRRRKATITVEERRKATYEQMATRVESSIRDHFTLELGRPELLNRIGDNIVVFDFIDQETGRRIVDLMLSNIWARVHQEHGVTLELTEKSRDLLVRECLTDETLQYGGRGIGSRLETILINPLATALFLNPQSSGSTVALDVQQESSAWTATLRPH